jgi:hypothetical protein
LWQFLPFGDGKKGAAGYTTDFFGKKGLKYLEPFF